MESKITREEQIKQAEIKYSNDTLFDGCDYIGQVAKQEAFIAGAKWADATMVKRACDWLENELFEEVAEPNPCYYSDVKSKTYDFVENFIENFRKAMEDNYEN